MTLALYLAFAFAYLLAIAFLVDGLFDVAVERKARAKPPDPVVTKIGWLLTIAICAFAWCDTGNGWFLVWAGVGVVGLAVI